MFAVWVCTGDSMFTAFNCPFCLVLTPCSCIWLSLVQFSHPVCIHMHTLHMFSMYVYVVGFLNSVCVCVYVRTYVCVSVFHLCSVSGATPPESVTQ